ncbi:hypothetical protein M3650_17975 [Paenibacillus sp. MER TA 81-3]|uniref:hypothetical protein n=1 Tax=Paenibacillus sp. MER TA 81-3 TaxID=2939573 RepID=UPI00203A7828|nr:hypothetical protein [Paenibacillus sp. MER TA 81-3]MCM3340477.1 hypothetical protein [Paenibacillus sp. MER TA 81-3]
MRAPFLYILYLRQVSDWYGSASLEAARYNHVPERLICWLERLLNWLMSLLYKVGALATIQLSYSIEP